MPNGKKGLYFTAVVFTFFFLFWRLISEVTERIPAKLRQFFMGTYSLITAVWKFDLHSTFPGIYPPRAGGGEGAKKAFLGPTLNFDQTYLCSGTWYQQSETNLSIYRGLPYVPPNLVNFGPEMAENDYCSISNSISSCSRLGDLGERRELPQRGPWWSPGRQHIISIF